MAEIYYLPTDYIRRSRYTSFLKNQSRDRILICWYIGPDTGRLFGVYWDSNRNEAVIYAYVIKDGAFEYNNFYQVDWLDLQDKIKKTPDLYCTEYMAYFMSWGNYPGKQKDSGKIIPFSTSYTKPKKPPTQPQKIYAPYGEPLPEGVKDFREALQRDGLVLIGWKILTNKTAVFYNVLWAKSNSRCRCVEWSGTIQEEQIPYVMPLDVPWRDCCDGETTFTIYVAPENILNGPYSDFRDYIHNLKSSGRKTNFDYDFIFAVERRKRFLIKNKELVNIKLSIRTINILNDNGIHTVNDLDKITIQELRNMRNMGVKTMGETLAMLKEAGITLKDSEEIAV